MNIRLPKIMFSKLFKIYTIAVLVAFFFDSVLLFNMATLILFSLTVLFVPGTYQRSKSYRVCDPKYSLQKNEDFSPFHREP